jgi:hypothetical protein
MDRQRLSHLGLTGEGTAGQRARHKHGLAGEDWRGFVGEGLDRQTLSHLGLTGEGTAGQRARHKHGLAGEDRRGLAGEAPPCRDLHVFGF